MTTTATLTTEEVEYSKRPRPLNTVGLANADVTLRHTDRIGIAVHFRNMAALCADNRGCSLTAIRHIRCFSMPRQTVPNGDAPPSNLSVHYPRYALLPSTAPSASIKYITTAIHLESVKARAMRHFLRNSITMA